MDTPTITIRTDREKTRTILLELNAEKFEKLASLFGFFSPSFIESLDRAEKDYVAGKIRKVKSLKELRKK